MLKRFDTIFLMLACFACLGNVNAQGSLPAGTDVSILRDSIGIYLYLSEEACNTNPQKAALLSNRARKISNLLNLDEQEAYASKILGESKINLEEYYEALKYLNLALSYYENTKNKFLTGEIHYLLGFTQYHLANYTNSLDHHLKALQVFGENEETRTQYASTLQNMGMLFHAMNDLVKAMEYYSSALEINIDLDNKENIASLYQNLGILSYKNNNDSTALENFNKSIKYFKDKHDLKGLGSTYSNIGLIYLRKGQASKAYRNFDKSLSYFIKTNYKLGQMWALNNLGMTYAMQGKFPEAEQSYYKSLEIAQDLNSPEGFMSNCISLVNFYEKRGYFAKALEFQKKYTEIKDSIFQINTKQKITELESLYQLESDERVQSQLISENKRQKTQLWAISGLLSILVIATLIIFSAYFQKRRAEKKLAEHKTNLEHLVDSRTRELQKQISGRKIAEESDKLKSSFLANMSHELRTPMNAIIAFSNFLREPDLTEKRKNEYLDHITSAGDSLLRLVDDIIDIAKIESKQLKIFIQPTSINRLLNELYKIFSETRIQNKKKLIQFNLVSDTKFNYIINTDAQRLKQVLTNLIENAFKYTDKGRIDFGFQLGEQSVTFFVSDTGVGIPKDKQELIFSRFYQLNHMSERKTSGTGLGLAICKNLAALLGGNMWLESEPGKGSTFYIKIPVDSVKKQPNPQFIEESLNTKRQLQQGYNWNNITILVAEDEDLNYKVLDTCLTRTNAHIIRAKDGASAIEICRNQRVDVVLMDIQLPGLDGYTATQEIKKMNNRTPVIAQTSFAMTGEKEKCLQAGCDDFVSKPLNIELLLQKIEHYIK